METSYIKWSIKVLTRVIFIEKWSCPLAVYGYGNAHMAPATMVSQCKCKIHQISKDLVTFFSYLNNNKIISWVQVTQNLSYQRLNNLFFVRRDVQCHNREFLLTLFYLSSLLLFSFICALLLLFSIVFISRLPFFFLLYSFSSLSPLVCTGSLLFICLSLCLLFFMWTGEWNQHCCSQRGALFVYDILSFPRLALRRYPLD